MSLLFQSLQTPTIPQFYAGMETLIKGSIRNTKKGNLMVYVHLSITLIFPILILHRMVVNSSGSQNLMLELTFLRNFRISKNILQIITKNSS